MAGTQCCENPPALDSTSGVGHVEEIGGLKSYVSAISSSSIAVILISDMFGTFFSLYTFHSLIISTHSHLFSGYD